MTDRNRPANHPGEENYRTSAPGHVAEPGEATPPRDRGLGYDLPFEEENDSGFHGAGSNEGLADDNVVRDTTPGYQGDKHDRGTVMPRS
jgi:hypothetical protein